MKFFKYHGTGNDFIIIDNREGEIRENEKSDLSIKLCDRHFGVGGDGLILVEPSNEADTRMRIFNPNGSEAEMCGNGIRCTGRFLLETGLRSEDLSIETLAGVKELEVKGLQGGEAYFRVDMGAPVDVSLGKKLDVEGEVWEYSYVDMGVPHVVLFVEDVDSVEIEKIAPKIRFNQLFPRGANVNFVEKVKDRSFKIRTYERGVERETLACGTGISASGVVVVFQGLAEGGEDLEFQARGGNVLVNVVKQDGGGIEVFMSGPAEFVFEGDVAF
jgi:diaminopimelate epimerase